MAILCTKRYFFGRIKHCLAKPLLTKYSSPKAKTSSSVDTFSINLFTNSLLYFAFVYSRNLFHLLLILARATKLNRYSIEISAALSILSIITNLPKTVFIFFVENILRIKRHRYHFITEHLSF